MLCIRSLFKIKRTCYFAYRLALIFLCVGIFISCKTPQKQWHVLGQKGNREEIPEETTSEDEPLTFNEGLKERNPLFIGAPVDTIKEEGILEFDFVVELDGTVSSVEALPTTKLGLKKIGIETISKWRFSPVEEGEPLRVRVKISFKKPK